MLKAAINGTNDVIPAPPPPQKKQQQKQHRTTIQLCKTGAVPVQNMRVWNGPIARLPVGYETLWRKPCCMAQITSAVIK